MAEPDVSLRRGWTTGACATAGREGGIHGIAYRVQFPDPVEIVLPRGDREFPSQSRRNI